MVDRIPVQVLLAPAEYRALAKIADKRNLNAHTLIEHLVRRALAPKPLGREQVETLAPTRPTTPTAARPYRGSTHSVRDEQFVLVKKLHAKGWSDPQIAEALNVPISTARHRRQQLKLPALGKPGRRPKSINQEERNAA